jgi:hypothetical protein
MLPVGGLASAVKPIVSGASRASKSLDDLRRRESGKVVSETHGSNISGKIKSAMPKIKLA